MPNTIRIRKPIETAKHYSLRDLALKVQLGELVTNNDLAAALLMIFGEGVNIEMASKSVMARYINADVLSAEELDQVADMYPEWSAGVGYHVNDIVRYQGKLYITIQQHVSQVGWESPTVPALFKPTVQEGIIPDWQQPTGAHDAYNIGDLVRFNGQVYKSLINGNSWSPAAYPAGWELQG